MTISRVKAALRAPDWVGIVVFGGAITIGELADRFLWDVLPRALNVASEIVGAILVLWLGMHGYERFLKPGHDNLDLVSLRFEDPDAHRP